MTFRLSELFQSMFLSSWYVLLMCVLAMAMASMPVFIMGVYAVFASLLAMTPFMDMVTKKIHPGFLENEKLKAVFLLTFFLSLFFWLFLLGSSEKDAEQVGISTALLACLLSFAGSMAITSLIALTKASRYYNRNRTTQNKEGA
jgi:hypothetical protein